MKKIICFDLDGTLIDGTVYIWRTLYEKYVTDTMCRKKIMSDFFSGKITYEQWFEADLNIFRAAGITKEKILSAIADFSLMPGTVETLLELKNRGYITAIISGSLNVVVDKFIQKELFDYIFVNHIFFDQAGHISGGKATPYDMLQKADGLRHILEQEGDGQTVFVGDNDNDIAIASFADFSIAFNCRSQKLASVCSVQIKEKDLRLILPLVDI